MMMLLFVEDNSANTISVSYTTVRYFNIQLNSFIPIIDHFFQYLGTNQSQGNLEIIISVAYYIIKVHRNPIYDTILTYPNIIKSIMKGLVSKSAVVRKYAITFFSNYTRSDNKNIAAQLMDIRFLDFLKECYEMSFEKPQFDLIMVQWLICVSNVIDKLGNILADKSSIISDLIANHEIMKIIIDCAHFKQQYRVQQNSVFCLHNFIIDGNFQALKYIVEKYNLV